MKKIFAMLFLCLSVACMAQNSPKKQLQGKAVNVSEKQVREIKLQENPSYMDVPLLEVFKERKSTRKMAPEVLSEDMVSSLLWAANGYNRRGEKKRTAPSAMNCQEIDMYVFDADGVYVYNADRHSLILVADGDHRSEIADQPMFKMAPISIVLVANYDKMGKMDEENKKFYGALDAGYVSQNINLFCASARLATVPCGGLNRDRIMEILSLKNAKPIVAHPVGKF